MPPGEQPAKPLEPSILTELRALAQRAQRGDVSVLPRMRQILTDYPVIWQHAGDVERIVVREWTEALGDGDPLSTDAIRRKAEALRNELEGENPTPIERLLVGQ